MQYLDAPPVILKKAACLAIYRITESAWPIRKIGLKVGLFQRVRPVGETVVVVYASPASVLEQCGSPEESTARLQNDLVTVKHSLAEEGWEIDVLEKPLRGLQDEPVPTIRAARAAMQAFYSGAVG